MAGEGRFYSARACDSVGLVLLPCLLEASGRFVFLPWGSGAEDWILPAVRFVYCILDGESIVRGKSY